MSEKKSAPIINVTKINNMWKDKWRECADGRNQRECLIKDDTSAPKVATEAILLTCIINAMEHWKVSPVDIPGAFIQADMEGETVHVKLEGKIM